MRLIRHIGPSPRYLHPCRPYFVTQSNPKGNLLIRPRPVLSRSPYNFEIVLLDHGLYFDLDRALRINYSKLWLALIAPASPENNVNRRKYAQLVGNVDSDRVSPCYIPVLVTRSSRPSILYLRRR